MSQIMLNFIALVVSAVLIEANRLETPNVGGPHQPQAHIRPMVPGPMYHPMGYQAPFRMWHPMHMIPYQGPFAHPFRGVGIIPGGNPGSIQNNRPSSKPKPEIDAAESVPESSINNKLAPPTPTPADSSKPESAGKPGNQNPDVYSEAEYNQYLQGIYNSAGQADPSKQQDVPVDYNKPAASDYNRPTYDAAGGYGKPDYSKPAQGGYGKPDYSKPAQGGYEKPDYSKPAQGGYGNKPASINAINSAYGGSYYGGH